MAEIVVIAPPPITEADLRIDESETRTILTFYWPQDAEAIVKMAVTNDVRLLAQRALIAGIDSSYAMGFVHGLFLSVSRPHQGLKSIAQKLARNFVRHWWKHATQKGLENVKIYESVRLTISLHWRFVLEDLLKTGKSRIGIVPVFAARVSSMHWA